MNIEEALNQFFEKLRRRLESLEQAINTLPCDNYLWGNWREDEKILSSEEDALETTEYTNREMPLDAKDIDVPTNRWISVKDRLPEMGEHYQSDDVLVCIDYRPDDPDTTEDTYVSIDHVDFNCFGQGEFSCERDDPRGGEPSPYFVTHWQPMPEPPEMGKAEE